MNNYPSWWNRTITIFNKFEDKQTQIIKWYKTVIEDSCFWKDVSQKISFTGVYSTDDIILQSSQIICRIPKQENFLEKFNWINTPNDLMEQFFTLGVGDIIILGEVDDVIDEYTKGKRSSDLLTKYKEFSSCLEIKRVTINVGGGRGNEHYYVVGE